MTYLPRPGEGGDFTPPPAGAHPALCYRLIDLGTQTSTYKGDEKTAHKILIGWELKGDEMVMEDGRPFSIQQRYTWSMHEKATLRKHLEAWRGAKFQDKDFGEGGFDVRALLGKACMISIIHEDKEGKTYANISSISKMPKGLVAGSLFNETVYLWLSAEGFDQSVFDQLSDSLQATIKRSPEYQELIGAKTRGVVKNSVRQMPRLDDPYDEAPPF